MTIGRASIAFVVFALVAACSSGANDGFGGAGGSTGTGQNGGSGAQGSSGGGAGSGSGGSDAGSSGNGGGGADSGTTTGHDGGSSGGGNHDAGTSSDSGSTQADSGSPNSGFDQFQQHNLDVINMYRATLNIAPLALDKQLSTFALAGSQELSMDHMPHQHFIDASNNGTLWSSGFTSSAGENQGDPNGWPKASSDPTTNEMTQIDEIQKAMFDEGPGSGEAHGHYENMMNAAFKRVGVGLLEVNGMLYLTNDFSD